MSEKVDKLISISAKNSNFFYRFLASDPNFKVRKKMKFK